MQQAFRKLNTVHERVAQSTFAREFRLNRGGQAIAKPGTRQTSARSATQTHDVWESPSARPFADSDVRTGSVAADRRTEALMRGTASPVANDPIDW